MSAPGLSRAFAKLMLQGMLGERIGSFPHEVRGTLVLHYGDDTTNEVMGSERPATLITESPTSGRIEIDGSPVWADLDIPEGQFTTLGFMFVLDDEPLFGDLFKAAGHPVKVVRGDTLRADRVIPFSFGAV